MIKLSLSAIAKILNIPPPETDTEFQGVSIDSRTLVPGNLFIALSGERYNGHDFISDAIAKGASAILVEQETKASLPLLRVPNTLEALGKISELWRSNFNIPFVGITGSNGKTTLKNMVASILRAACNDAEEVLATEGNLNNHIGVPLMLCRLNAKHRFAVLEMGMNHFGEIEYLTKLVCPQVATINNAASAHLEGLKDVAGVAKAKGEIFLGLQPRGTAILNRDDPNFSYWQTLVANHPQLHFGFQEETDVTAEIINPQTFLVKTAKGNIEIMLPLLGRHNVMNALAATATTFALNIDLVSIKKGLENMQPAPGRMNQHLFPNEIRIIDDTYNANPASLNAAVKTLATYPGNKILVLGDMKELGSNAKQLHAEAGEQIRAAGINLLFTLGEISHSTCETFGAGASHFTDHQTLADALQPFLKNNTTILIKGSRSMRMEKVVGPLLSQLQAEKTL